MFQFTTTTVINANQDYSTGETPLWSAQDGKGGNVASFNIKRHLKFLKPNVLSITKAEYTESKVPEATLNIGAMTAPVDEDKLYRIAMYIRLSDSANSYYANDLVFKGRPFYIEFVWKKGEAAAKVAERIKKMTKKFMITVYEKELVKISVSGAVVTIKGTDEYQRFTRMDIEEFVKKDTCPIFGGFEVVKSALPSTMATLEDGTTPNPDYDAQFKIEQGVEGFGTYQYILKNLRLPTAARLSYGAVNADEAPILGAKYNEYVIRYCVNRGVMGGDAVGEVSKSLTTHVFFVNQAIASDFETGLQQIAPETGIEKVPADKDDKKENTDHTVDQNGDE